MSCLILPLPLLSSAPDTAVLDLASKESLARDCGSSDCVSLRGSLKPISSVKWKQDSWHRFLFGRICAPSHTASLEDWWILRLRESLASHTASPESEPVDRTSASCLTHGSTDSRKCSQDSSSSRTSRVCSQAECQMTLFALHGPSRDWKQWVTGLRQAYSARLKSARPTNASGSSSWPTISVNESKNSQGGSQAQRNTPPLGTVVLLVETSGRPAPANPSTNGSHQEPSLPANPYSEGSGGWQTPTVSRGGHTQVDGTVTPKLDQQVKSWATPRSGKTTDEDPETWAKRQAQGNVATMPLTAQVKAWATPQAHDAQGPKTPEQIEAMRARGFGVKNLNEQVQTGKLNPRWVETLMNLPVGWTMPSCASPVTIAPTNSDSSEMASCLPPQPLPSRHS